MNRLALLYKPLLAVALIFLVFACGGGGCSGCESCGIRPIPGAFPIGARIPNAAQIRLSESGIGFIETNIDAIVRNFLPTGLDFPVPPIDQSQSVPVVGNVRIRLCVDGNCMVHGAIDSLEITPTAPNVLNVVIRVTLESRDGAGARSDWDLRLGPSACVFGLCAVDTTCQLDIDTARSGATPPRTTVAFATNITFATDMNPARAGYTVVDIGPIAEVPGEGIEEQDIDFGSCSGISGAIINLAASLLRGTLIDQLRGQLGGLLDGALGDNLCTRAGEFGCPTGTFADGAGIDAICRYGMASTDACVPTLLGTDGRGDLGEALLGGFSPGAHAPIQFVLAAGGDGEAVMNGMSLFMVGGFQSWNRDFTTTPGHNACVPLIEPPPLPTVARADAFRTNTIPGTAISTHVGIGISEDYLDYAGYGLFDAGALCLGTGTRLSQQLSTGLVSALVRSLAGLAFPVEDAPLALAIRPQQPPDFTIGTTAGEPLLGVTLPEVQIDFYVWSTERYVRFMTFQTDLVVDIDLTVEGGQIVPSIESITPTNSVVTNTELISDDPAALAPLLESLIGMFAGMLGSGLSPIDLPAIMGFNLEVPDGGLRGLDSSLETFLGIFANLSLAPAMPITASVETTLEFDDIRIDPESMSVENWNRGEGNSVWLYLGADGPMGVEYEYSYRIDGTEWRPWTTDRRVQIDDAILLLQARHVIEARARVVGSPLSIDPTPATAELLIDILAPTLELEQTETGFTATARDIISDEDALEYRFRAGSGAWTEWTAARDLALGEDELRDVTGVDVEVRDEAGNIATTSQALIRGIPNPAGGGGCGCRAAGSPGAHAPLGALLAFLTLGLLWVRRGRKEAAPSVSTFRRGTNAVAAVRSVLLVIGVLAVTIVGMGCQCGTPSGPPCRDECSPAAPPGRLGGTACCARTDMCVDYNVDALCEPGFTCPTANVEIDGACEITCSMCMEKPRLAEGILALDLDFSVMGTDRFVSGYSPGAPPSQRYGDLVFGEIGATGAVTWEIVDGAPTMPITNSVMGWRGGVSAPGPDVGRWTSLVDGGMNIYIAYYDVSNGDLRIAIGSPGSWRVHTVDATGDSGRYASIVLNAAGAPAISYLRAESLADGTVRSSIRVAVARSASPTGPTDWTTSEVSGSVTPCRAAFCGTGQVCLASGACRPTGGTCTPACGSDQACVMGTCQAIVADGYVEDIAPVYGAYTRLVVAGTGFGAIWYDRSQGNLWGASSTDGTTWGAPFLIDGYMRTGGGDSGIGASLFIDTAGTWHITYVNGTDEELRYAQVTGGTVGARELIDDGSTDGTTGHTDGRHVVGDDSSVVVLASGEVRVAYQDATNATTMLARRTAPGTWSVEVLDDMDASGFWVEQEVSATGSTVVSWWRRADRTTTNGVRVTAVP